MANTLRKEIDPSLLPTLARAQWNLAAHIMRRAEGGDLISRAALPKFRELADFTDSLVELQNLTGGEVFLVSFRNGPDGYWDRDLIDWAVEYTAEDDPDSLSFKELRDDWPATEWQEWGR